LFFFQAADGIRDSPVTGVQTCALPIYHNWARHLLAIRDLQRETGGFTEFVPLPFVAEEAPVYRRGLARQGPTFREAVLMHAIAQIGRASCREGGLCSGVDLWASRWERW